MDRSKDAGAARPGLVDEMMLMSQLPLILFCDWWTTALQSFHHDCSPRRPACSAEDEGQRRGARGLYSRHVAERLVHPPLSRPSELVDWLVDHGESHPGTLLYPPNDHLAWLFAAERDRLSKVFAMYSPSEDAVFTLLDKKRLHDACADVGIDVPRTLGLAEQSSRFEHGRVGRRR